MIDILWYIGIVLAFFMAFRIVNAIKHEDPYTPGGLLGVTWLMIMCFGVIPFAGFAYAIGYAIWRYYDLIGATFDKSTATKIGRLVFGSGEQFDLEAHQHQKAKRIFFKRYGNQVDLALLELEEGQEPTVEKEILTSALDYLDRDSKEYNAIRKHLYGNARRYEDYRTRSDRRY